MIATDGADRLANFRPNASSDGCASKTRKVELLRSIPTDLIENSAKLCDYF